MRASLETSSHPPNTTPITATVTVIRRIVNCMRGNFIVGASRMIRAHLLRGGWMFTIGRRLGCWMRMEMEPTRGSTDRTDCHDSGALANDHPGIHHEPGG